MNLPPARIVPPLDPEFYPAFIWNRAYQAQVDADVDARSLDMALVRADGTVFRHACRVLGALHRDAEHTLRYVERLIKFLLWQKGSSRILIAGAPEITSRLAAIYSSDGARAFDHSFIGHTVYGEPLVIEETTADKLPTERSAGMAIGRNLDGCRIGFDLGGSDRKSAALIDGKVVYSEEIPWSPYFQEDPAYHLDGVHDSLQRAAAHLPRVDAIGGSAAGVYVNNEVRGASLFRGVPQDKFNAHIRRMFFTLQSRWNGVPFEVANDGEVTALAGSMSLGENAVLGISMGTSQAAGYVTPEGNVTPWLNELAFAPIDYRLDAPRDEWSGDLGCGVQYFSQQGVARLAQRAGIPGQPDMSAAERLVEVQQLLSVGDSRARAVFETIGICFGYAIAHYAQFYTLRHVLVLGRVTSGIGGTIILEKANTVLAAEAPELAATVRLSMPNEKDKRHGQAIAAASLPALKR